LIAKDYTRSEVMACAISHSFKNGERGFTGLPTGPKTSELIVGIPIVAMALAKATHAPNFSMMLAGWVVDPSWDELPTEELMGEYEDKFLGWSAVAHLSEEECLIVARKGLFDVGFSTGVQVDKYGNLNTVCIGDYHKPKVRLIGPIFLPEHMSLFNREIIMMPHERRRFVDRVDYISAVGFLDGPGTREKAGLKRGGPQFVITDLAILGFDDVTKRMSLVSVHPGVTVDEVIKNTGFELIIPQKVPETPPPTQEEIDLIRNKIDPGCIFLHR
jgi:glutaconate CoA-transferase subunit B